MRLVFAPHHIDGGSRSLERHKLKEQARIDSARVRREHFTSISEKWPQVIPPKVMLQCLNDHHFKSAYKFPSTCAICGRAKDGLTVSEMDVSATSNLADCLRCVLCVANNFVLEHSSPDEFRYGLGCVSILNDLYLER